MKNITLKNLDKISSVMPAGYKEAVLSVASVADGIATISDEDFYRLNPKAVLPPIPTMAAGLIKSAMSEGAAVLAGQPSASPEEADRRFAICQTPCEFFRVDDKRCAKCGCFMEFKARLRTASCPVGKW